MDMPLSVAVRTAKEKLIEDINASGLPIEVMDLILSEIKFLVHEKAEQEYLRILNETRKEDGNGTD